VTFQPHFTSSKCCARGQIRAGLNEREAPGKIVTARPLNA